MPVLPRQLGLQSLISEGLQSRLSTASTALFSPTPVVVTPTSTLPAQQTVPVATIPVITESTPIVTVTRTVVPSTSNVVTPTPTISVIVFTTTTSSPVVSTTQAVTSSIEALSSSSSAVSSSSPVSSPVLITPVAPIPEVSAAPTTSRSATSAAVSGTGVPVNVGGNTQSNSGMSGGIIALIVVGALLAALLAGAFTFRRVQVYRRAKRRENNYGAGPVDTAPFPFTNVSETDMKGAEPITRDFRQGSAPSINEKPLPSIAPVEPSYAGLNASLNFGLPTLGANMSGPYPTMGAAAGYGYGQNDRTASPAPRIASPAPPAPFMRTASPAPSNTVPPSQYPTAPTASLTVPAPTGGLAPHLRGRKRVVQTFQPTLPDELDIRDGDWVTIVHAYDDGWGLCERNGRRGVVPLECLDIGRSDVRASRRLSSLSAIRQ